MTAQGASSVRRVMAGVLAALSLSVSVAAHAQTAPATQATGQAEDMRRIHLYSGQSRVVDAPWPVRRLSVIDPSIADVDVSSASRVSIQGKSPGMTEVVMWNAEDEVWQARVEVEADLSRLQSQLAKLFPDADLTVSQLGDVIAVSGTLPRAEQVSQLREFMAMTNQKFLDVTSVAGVQQVQLQVRVAEVSRTALGVLGINAFYDGDRWFGGIQLGSDGAPFVPMTNFAPDAVPPSATIFAGFPNSDLLVFLQALSENQFVRILAEPTLMAKSGEEASFLAGGEVPIPITEVTEGTTQISVEYKEFGIRLHFRPIVLGDGRIELKVMPEVSELTDVGSIVVFGSRVPAFITRRVETTLELNNGQTFAIAGLISRQENARVSRVPGLGDIPILGTLFRSIRYQQEDTELLVLVTASLAEASSTNDIPGPGDLHESPNAWELYINGQLEGKTRKLSPAYQARLEAMGLDQLEGPGTWATYDAQPDNLAGETQQPGMNQSLDAPSAMDEPAMDEPVEAPVE